MVELKHKSVLTLLVITGLIAGVGVIPGAFAQTELPSEIPINFSVSQLIVIGLGIAGGITVAMLGKAKAEKEDESFEFDARKYARPILIAALTSIPLAITAAIGFVELNLVTMFLIYTASLGTAAVSKMVK